MTGAIVALSNKVQYPPYENVGLFASSHAEVMATNVIADNVGLKSQYSAEP